MGILDKYKVGSADVYGRSKYFPNSGGNFDVVITKCKVTNGKKKVCYIVECEVEASDNAELKVGDTVAQIMNLDDEFGYGAADLKRFVCELHGIDPSKPDALARLKETDDALDVEDPVTAFAEFLVEQSEEAPLGLPAKVRAWLHTTKNDKKVTRIAWAPR